MTETLFTPIEALMAQLAGQANSNLMKSNGLNFPDRWDVLEYFDGSGSVGIPATQGFLAKGNIDPDDPTSPVVGALVLGINWKTFLAYMRYSSPNPISLPDGVMRGEGTGKETMEFGFVMSYSNVRSAIWDSIQQFLGDLDLYICGMGIGAPMAQLAALDLRPSATPVGPSGQYPPLVQPLCYTFSAANLASDQLVQFYNKKVVRGIDMAATTYWAKKPGLVVDFFPFDPPQGVLGKSQSINTVKLPTVDVPWLERGNVFYIEQLGAQLDVGPNVSADYNFPVDFDLVMASNCSQFVVAAYGQIQHNSGGNPSGYTLVSRVNANGSPFAFIFTNSVNVVVTFRGTITWQEALTITANSDLTGTNDPIYGEGMVHTGINTLYYSPTEIGGNVNFNTALVSEINKVITGKKLYLTGHDIGGSLANFAAIDFATNTGLGLTVQQVYTFGAICLGESTFASNFGKVTGEKCYQINRVFDSISTALLGSPAFYAQLNNSIVLNGQLTVEENTYHSINGYMKLLNPS